MTAHGGNIAARYDRRILVAALGVALALGTGFGAWQMTTHQSTRPAPSRDAAVVQQVAESVPVAGSPAATAAQSAAHSTLLVVDAASAPVDGDRAVQSMNGFLAFNGMAPLQHLMLPAMVTASGSKLSQALQSMNAILAANNVGPVSAETVAPLLADPTALVNQAVQSMNAFLAPNGVPPVTAVTIAALAIAAP